MDIPISILDLLYRYRWYVLAPGIMLVVITLLRGEKRILLVFSILVGGLILFRNYPLVHSLYSAVAQLLLYLEQLAN